MRVSSAATTVAASSAATSRGEASPQVADRRRRQDDHRPSLGWTGDDDREPARARGTALDVRPVAPPARRRPAAAPPVRVARARARDPCSPRSCAAGRHLNRPGVDETYYVRHVSWKPAEPRLRGDLARGRGTAFNSGQTDASRPRAASSCIRRSGSTSSAPAWRRRADSSFGWRIAVALCGTACVLTPSPRGVSPARSSSPTVASFLAVHWARHRDGAAWRSSTSSSRCSRCSRSGFTVLDRRRHLDRLAAGIAARQTDAGPHGGPAPWNRPASWPPRRGGRGIRGQVVGRVGSRRASASTSWSDGRARRPALGVTFWPTDAAFRQGPATFLLLVPAARSSSTSRRGPAGSRPTAATAAPASTPTRLLAWTPSRCATSGTTTNNDYASTSGITYGPLVT